MSVLPVNPSYGSAQGGTVSSAVTNIRNCVAARNAAIDGGDSAGNAQFVRTWDM